MQPRLAIAQGPKDPLEAALACIQLLRQTHGLPAVCVDPTLVAYARARALARGLERLGVQLHPVEIAAETSAATAMQALSGLDAGDVVPLKDPRFNRVGLALEPDGQGQMHFVLLIAQDA